MHPCKKKHAELNDNLNEELRNLLEKGILDWTVTQAEMIGFLFYQEVMMKAEDPLWITLYSLRTAAPICSTAGPPPAISDITEHD